MPEQQQHTAAPTPETTTVTMASDEPQPQLPGLGDPPAGRSDVATMGTDGSGVEKEAMGAAGGPLGDFVLIGAPWGLLLAPTQLSARTPDKKKVSAHRPCPETPTMLAAAKGEKKKKQCVQCGATETPQWRIHPTGLGALCNACRIQLRPAEALREPVHVRVHHLPPPATPTTTVISRREKSPSPATATVLRGPVHVRVHLPPLATATPTTTVISSSRRDKSPSPAPATAAQEEEKKKRERKRKPRHPPRKSSKQCHHCKSAASTAELWSMGPVGRPSTLCDACGMRYWQGRLLQEQENRPAASPKAIIDGSPETHIVYAVGGDELQMADPSSLDEFLFNGPSAPLLIDNEEDFAN